MRRSRAAGARPGRAACGRRRAARPRARLSNEGEASRLLRAIIRRLAVLAREDGLEGQRADLVERRVGDRRRSGSRGRSPVPRASRARSGWRGRRPRGDCSGSASTRTRPSSPDTIACDLVAQVLLGGVEGHGGRVERLQHVERHARRASPACRRPRRGPSSSAAMSSGPRPHSARPFFQAAAVSAAAAFTSLPSRRAASASIQGSKDAASSFSKRSSRFARSPFGSMARTGTPWRSSSSRRTMARPVLPEPVMPTIRPWVSRSAGSSSSRAPSDAAFRIDLLSEVQPVAHADPPDVAAPRVREGQYMPRHDPVAHCPLRRSAPVSAAVRQALARASLPRGGPTARRLLQPGAGTAPAGAGG